MEDICVYISSRGIAKSCSFYPKKIISDNTKYKFYLNNVIILKNQFDGMSIYVVSNLLKTFVSDILPKIKKKFILVSGASVKTCPVEALNAGEFNKLMSNPNLIRWCSQNNTIVNRPKIVQIPLGLDYHTISSNPSHLWNHDKKHIKPIDQETELINIKLTSKPFYLRERRIFVNFNLSTDRLGQRKDCLNAKISKELLCVKLETMTRIDTWKMTANYAFVLSPYGNGMDCHRTWEALLLGSIPIIKTDALGALFKDLPVLIVQNWSDINQELLDNTIELFKNKEFNYAKLTLNYWNKYLSL
jgi:hypothetical protein